MSVFMPSPERGVLRARLKVRGPRTPRFAGLAPLGAFTGASFSTGVSTALTVFGVGSDFVESELITGASFWVGRVIVRFLVVLTWRSVNR
jgi:hypothetical protein